MKASHFRLGDFAQDQNGNVLEVAALEGDNIEFTVVDRSKFPLPDGWQAQPIPITQDWLLRLGFNKYDGKGSFYFHSILKWAKFHYNSRTNICEFAVNNDASVFNVKYVHEVQNIFFSCTGVELQIKPL